MANGGQLVPRRTLERLLRAAKEVERRFHVKAGRPPSPVHSHITNERVGIIVEKGPSGQGDFTDHRYWVQLAEPVPITRNPPGPAEANDPAYFDGIQTGEYEERIVCVTNVAEELHRGHLLFLGQTVIVRGCWEDGEVRFPRRWMCMPPPQPFIWFQVEGSVPRPLSPPDGSQWRYFGRRMAVLSTPQGPRYVDPVSGYYVRVIGSSSAETVVNAFETNNKLRTEEATQGNGVYEGGDYPDQFNLLPIGGVVREGKPVGKPVVRIYPLWLGEPDELTTANKMLWTMSEPNDNDGLC